MEITIRQVTADEVRPFRENISRAFGNDADEAHDEQWLAQVDLDRTYCAFDGNVMVGTAAAFSFEMTIPGGVAPTGGLSMVSVRPSHRRRGALRSMIDAHLADVHGRDEAFSALWASEATIYGRFGYGDAVDSVAVEIDVTHTDLRSLDDGTTIAMIDLDEARDVLPGLYDQHRSDRSGLLSRSDVWWEERHYYDGPERRRGASSKRYVLAMRDDVAVGYVVYRQTGEWEDDIPRGTTRILDMVGDEGAVAALWRFLASIDLFPRVRWSNAPFDDPARWLSTNPRAVSSKVGEGLWVRLMDVERCLELRKYRAEGELVLAVADDVLSINDRTHKLVVDHDGDAICTPTDAVPDVTLDVSTLGALYLGGRNARQLAAAGLIGGSAEAIRKFDDMMRWDAPWCADMF